MHLMPQPPPHRSEVDGLRAVAVLSVVLFHLFPGLFPGGYVGVDCFFVISGFFITQLLYTQASRGAFGLADFYDRRMRRLVPPLLGTLALSAIGAALVMPPADLVKFSEAMVAGLLFVPNLYFWQEAGYFADAHARPLLHLWSLGVEAQFYLLWPIVLMLLLRRRVRVTLAVMLAVGLLSLLGAVLLHPTAPKAAFFLVFTRMFEFLIGGAVVFLPATSILQRSRILADLAMLAGLGAIAACVALLNQHPVYVGLLPSLATALVLYSSQHARVAIFLSNRVMAYLGRISYEVYLLHWPILILYGYVAMGEPTVQVAAALIAVTIALAALMYHTISLPLRYGFKDSPNQRYGLMTGCLVCMLMLLATAFSMKLSQGWHWRLSQEARLMMRDAGGFHKTTFGGAGYAENTLLTLGDARKPPLFLLIGDSFAGQYAAGFSEFLSEHQRSALLYHVNGCMIMPQLVGNASGTLTNDCRESFARVAAIVREKQLPVIHAQSWGSFKEQLALRDGTRLAFPKETNDAYYQYLMQAIVQMRAAIGPHPYLVVGIAPGIAEQQPLMRCFQVPTLIPTKCAENVALKEDTQWNGLEFNNAMKALAASNPAIGFINPREAMCKDGLCYAIQGAKIFYSDRAHFTKDGALEVIRHYQNQLLAL